ncbi:hypothetical protein R1flu_009490 [Riccia fluitans]|uniref:Cytochrome P450 n=1 Tax=Riccia fluitans TaxID=41844 RepID=A0ABD1Z2D9_9MARC
MKEFEENAQSEVGVMSPEYVNAVTLVVTALCVVQLVRVLWNWQTEGLRSIPTKGSLGWPILGEMPSLLRCAGTYTLESCPRSHLAFVSWLRERVEKYGTMFKTHVLFRPTIMMTTPEEIRFVLDDPDKKLSNGAPETLKRLLGSFNVFALAGQMHRDIHKILADSALVPELKRKTPEFDRLIRHSMSTWNGRTLDLLGAVQYAFFKAMTFNFFGISWEHEIADKAAALLSLVMPGVVSVPINLPGTAFYKAQNARKKLDKIFLPIIQEMRSTGSDGSSKYASVENFPYHSLLKYEINGEQLSDIAVVDILLSAILSGEGPSNVVSIALIYLKKNPPMLKRAQVEVDQLRKLKKESGEPDFSLSDLRELKYLTQVFHEALRITTIAPGVVRSATADIHFKGHVIPKGWITVAPFALIHMDPELYPEPSKFNPDRFENPPNPAIFFPFGRGNRACIGRQFTRLMVLMILYHIISNFTWEVVNFTGKLKHLPTFRLLGKVEIAFESRAELS